MKTNQTVANRNRRFRKGWWLALALFLGALTPNGARAESAAVTLKRVPDGGLQPQAVTDKEGTVHLIYLKGDPKAADVYYTFKKKGAENFGRPIRVNSQAGSAIAVGTIRGAQIAVGQNGRVHVAWNGSQNATPKPTRGVPMLYARMNDAGTAFEPQRNLMLWTGGLDGGGSVCADAQGNVFVVWHGAPADSKPGEAGRAVYAAHSADNGKTFARETQLNSDATGACGCCGLRAFMQSDGRIYVLYRAATQMVNRDMTLLAGDVNGKFQATTLQRWQANMCPMSSAYMVAKADNVYAAWENGGQIYFEKIVSSGAKSLSPVAAPGSEKKKHPVMAGNGKGEMILAWTEGTGWQKGGSLAWQLYDAEGRAVGSRGISEGVPAWGLVATYAEPDGHFVVLY